MARQQLEQAGIAVDDAFVFTKGWLFYALPGCQLPGFESGGQGRATSTNMERDPEHLRAWWCHSDEFQKLVERSECDWRQLIKPNWLADQSSLLEAFEPDRRLWGLGRRRRNRFGFLAARLRSGFEQACGKTAATALGLGLLATASLFENLAPATLGLGLVGGGWGLRFRLYLYRCRPLRRALE